MANQKIEDIEDEIKNIKDNLIESEEFESYKKIKPLLMDINKTLRFSGDLKDIDKEMFEHVLAVEVEIRLKELDKVTESDKDCFKRLSDLRNKLRDLIEDLRS